MAPKPDDVRRRAVDRCRERNILIPTFAEMRDPQNIDPAVRRRLAHLDMQEPHPANLFRITWKNDVLTGGFAAPNCFEIPSELTGVRARIIGMVGKHFPTGAHKVGAAFGCLVPRLVNGQFDPTEQRAVWPSTGNYCRGGVFDSAVLGCQAVAILPEGMSRERFEWLEKMGAEIIATPGTEANVKEIFDACWDLQRKNPKDVILNQFAEMGNYLWHHAVTGPSAEEAFQMLAAPRDRFAAWVSATGSAGTIAAGDYLKKTIPGCRVGAAEPIQCPTLLSAGHGDHRIEGIGDKHVPWIHNVRMTDVVIAVDDRATLRLLRLFNEPAGQDLLSQRGLGDEVIAQLPLLGISSICNLLAAIKMSLYFEYDENDVIFMSLTDSADLYRSYLRGWNEERGAYTSLHAAVDHERFLLATTTDHMKELTYPDQKVIHNLKYFTWVEQQQRKTEELAALWNPLFWRDQVRMLKVWDESIREFNRDTGVLDRIRRETTPARQEHPEDPPVTESTNEPE